MCEKYIVTDKTTVKDAIEKMEKELIKAVIVLSDDNQVMGLFSNGDMRLFFLRGGNLSANITEAMNANPKLYVSEEEIYSEREYKTRVVYPIVDKKRHLINVLDFEQTDPKEKVNESLHDVPLVIMAGGKGTRLYPYTKILPKPLIPIGDITITERIINSFQRYGCKDVLMVLNYKAGMIKAYMSEIPKNYNISFVEEKEFLGTAGGLRLLRNSIDSTFFLSNCDILVNADFECIYKTHKEKGNKITFVCSMKDVVIPYGVVETNDDGSIRKMREKPDLSFLINTGLYMIEPEVIDDISPNEFIHLPNLAQKYLDKGERVGVFPISEKSWMDMGQINEMKQMIGDLGL